MANSFKIIIFSLATVLLTACESRGNLDWKVLTRPWPIFDNKSKESEPEKKQPASTPIQSPQPEPLSQTGIPSESKVSSSSQSQVNRYPEIPSKPTQTASIPAPSRSSSSLELPSPAAPRTKTQAVVTCKTAYTSTMQTLYHTMEQMDGVIFDFRNSIDEIDRIRPLCSSNLVITQDLSQTRAFLLTLEGHYSEALTEYQRQYLTFQEISHNKVLADKSRKHRTYVNIITKCSSYLGDMEMFRRAELFYLSGRVDMAKTIYDQLYESPSCPGLKSELEALFNQH